jgi:glycosyltransferase involved in cell wall biosynthesis
VIDDGSVDDSALLAEGFGARVLRHDQSLGPAAARNAGALAASAPIVFFLDADVVVHEQTLSRTLDHFANDPALAALFGSYDDNPAAPGLVSQFRNLLHHFVHQQGTFVGETRPAHTFWTGCGAIRRAVFLDLGGFDPHLYRRPAIEDIELGYRLTRAGHRVVLARDVQATHLKRWTLRSVVRTDIFQRGVPWMLLMMRSKVAESDLNVSQTQKICVASTGFGLLGLLISPKYPAALGLLAVNLTTVAALNAPFYRFLARRRGVAFAVSALPLHLLYYTCCGLSVAIALAIRHRPTPRLAARPEPTPRRARADAPGQLPAPPEPRFRRIRRWTRRP